MNFKDLKPLNKVATNFFTVRNTKTNVENVYCIKQGEGKISFKGPKGGGFAFYDYIEKKEYTLWREWELIQVQGAFLCHTDKESEQLLTSLNKTMEERVTLIEEAIKDVPMNRVKLQYVKGTNAKLHMVQLHNVFSSCLSFKDIINHKIPEAGFPQYKECWLEQIKLHVEEAVDLLEKEKAEYKDKDDIEEIDLVVEMLRDLPRLVVEKDWPQIDSFGQLIRFWPPLLLPSPSYVVGYFSGNTPDPEKIAAGFRELHGNYPIKVRSACPVKPKG